MHPQKYHRNDGAYDVEDVWGRVIMFGKLP